MTKITAWACQRETAIIAAWVLLVGGVAAIKAANPINPPRDAAESIALLLPFLVVAAAPVLGYRLGTSLFASRQQPALRLAIYGNWRPATPAELGKGEQGWRSFAWFSLVSGILLNVPFRAFEYLTSIPAVTSNDPMWAHILQRAFTIDCALACFAYAMCFAAAVQRSPLFARALVAAWLIDVALQAMIAVQVGQAPGIPAYLIEPMNALLAMNVKKVAISISIWLPYLLISDNLNLLLRKRVRLTA
ncbi:hypothetical protein [Novosphingobium taihuense]|uniref:DUF2569 domain-containing protein n=1 Tax=Novosphingobium taihuense TaxID=260085 RepID=A0A7W7EVN7_9SPHN|nr:hypothetical protein [Novosphingobium taihuense]MBB4615662.1 hypothetical protein [Novosphingobium taihuense]